MKNSIRYLFIVITLIYVSHAWSMQSSNVNTSNNSQYRIECRTIVIPAKKAEIVPYVWRRISANNDDLWELKSQLPSESFALSPYFQESRIEIRPVQKRNGTFIDKVYIWYKSQDGVWSLSPDTYNSRSVIPTSKPTLPTPLKQSIQNQVLQKHSCNIKKNHVLKHNMDNNVTKKPINYIDQYTTYRWYIGPDGAWTLDKPKN